MSQLKVGLVEKSQQTNTYVHFTGTSMALSWKPPKTLQHPLHKDKSKYFQHRKPKASLRPASWSNYTKIKDVFPGQFPIGGMLCTPHRKNPVEDLDVNIVDKDTDFVLPPALTDPVAWWE